MIYRISWSPLAVADLANLFDWIAERADFDIAEDYTTRIEAHVETLARAPHHGRPRDELGPGLRSTVYRRRTLIFYRVDHDEVVIAHVAHGGRDLAGLVARDD